MSNPYREISYEVYLSTEHWRKVRNRKLASAGFVCEKCGRGDALEVHHLSYENIGDEPLGDLKVLCTICHRIEHGIEPTEEDWNKVHFVYGHETIPVQRAAMERRRQARGRDIQIERRELV